MVEINQYHYHILYPIRMCQVALDQVTVVDKDNLSIWIIIVILSQ